MLAEIITAKIVAKVATKVLAPISTEHKSLEIAYKVVSALDNIGISDVKELVSLRKTRKALK
jgi:hypothetical protein